MNAEQRAEFLEQSVAHFKADMLLRGTYGEEGYDSFKGCSVGCHLHHIFPDATPDEVANMDEKHFKVAKHYGYPEWLALLQDSVFEGLPNGESAKWHVQLAEALHALPDDYDWQAALHRCHAAILRVTLPTAGTATEAVQAVIDLHEKAETDAAAWSAAKSAAESAARSAAESAARSAAWSAVWSAAWSAAESAAESAAYQKIRDGVLAALANVSVPA
jgi:hypothetical protein